MKDYTRGSYSKAQKPCAKNAGVGCTSADNCDTCGWNPAVSEARRKALRAKHVKPKQRVVALRA